MKYLIIRYFTLLMLISNSIALIAENAYNFNVLGLSYGLSDEYVLSSYIDSRGFLWVCTTNGLNRWDGHSFLHYSSSSSDLSTRIRSNAIAQMVEDKHHQLWMISDAGLSQMNLLCGGIQYFDKLDIPNAYYLSMPIFSIAKDGNDNIWLGQAGDVLHLLLDSTGQIRRIHKISLPSISATQLQIQGNRVWVGSSQHLELIQYDANHHTYRLDRMPQEVHDPFYGITALSATDSVLWVGTSHGLYQYDVKKKEAQAIHIGNTKNITCLTADKQGNIYVGSPAGLKILHPNGTQEYLCQGQLYYGLSSNYVTHITVDQHHCLWVGTLLGGLNRITLKQINFHYYMAGKGIDQKVITRLFVDHQGNILAAVLNNGLAIKKKGNSTCIYVPHIGDAFNGDANILAIIQDDSGNYWLGTRNGGLCMMLSTDISHPHFISYNVSNSNIHSNTVYDLALDRKRHGLWLCNGETVQFFDLRTHRFTDIHFSEDTNTLLPYTLHLDRNDRLWIGGNGLCVASLSVYNTLSREYLSQYYHYRLDEPNSKIFERISTILETKNGQIYIGSQCNGLFHLTKGSGCRDLAFCHLNFNYGFVDDKISMLLEGNDGRIWISTLQGIFVYDPHTHLSIHCNQDEGLLMSQFYVRSGCNLPNGALCFGSTNGFVMFQGSLRPSPEHRHVTISTVVVDGKMVALPTNKTLELSPDNMTIDITFSALDLIHPSEVVYAYQLEELSNQWTILHNSQHVSFTALRPGSYHLRLRCTNHNGTWSHNETLLTIIVRPPFYLSTGFYIFVIIIFSLSTWGLFLWYSHRQKTLQILLKKKIQLRSWQLAETMERNNNEKVELYTRLTHELKTPLTLILGPVSEIKERNNNAALTEFIQMIERNSKYLLHLVSDIMSLHPLNGSASGLKQTPVNIQHLLGMYVSNFQTILGLRNISIHYFASPSQVSILSDEHRIQHIVNNLLSNAAKYTPNGGHIKVGSTLIQDKKRPTVYWQYLSVFNSGSYIPAEERQQLFKCYYTSKGQRAYEASRSGIGLFVVKELTDALKGRISIVSRPDWGTCFRVIFPVEKEEEPVGSSTSSASLHKRNTVPSSNASSQPQLLLVEDNDDMRQYLCSVLSDRYQVIQAKDGEEGYQQALSQTPDFIISDLMMPVCDGLELCRRIRKCTLVSHVPFLMLTALSDEKTQTRCYESGADAFLSKPFDKNLLLTRIDGILSRRQVVREQVAEHLLIGGDDSLQVNDTDKLFLTELAATVKDHYADSEFSVAQLESLMHMGSTSLYKKITTLTGLTTSQYIRRYRLQTAHQLLQNQGDKIHSVADVAYATGFNDPKYFTRCFVKEYGVQPKTLIGK